MTRKLTSGMQIAGRYELQDLVSERFKSTSWRAHDAVLRRSVSIQAIASDDPRAEDFIAAATLSAAVTDPRFLRVLDVIEEFEGQTFVIREWARAYSLDQLLSESSLAPERAAHVVREVAEALAHAHRRQIYHRYLTPHGVLLKRNGAVRISGLATASALAGQFDQSSSQAYERYDVESIGWLLYACLTSHWPGNSIDELRAAPRENGRLLRPRKVIAGIPRAIDTVCDQILGDPPRYGATPLRTAQDIALALAEVEQDESWLREGDPDTDVSRLDPVVPPSGPPPGIAPPRARPKALEPAPPTATERGIETVMSFTRGHRALITSGVLVGVVVFAVLAFLVGRATTSQQSSTPRAPVESYTIADVLDFDPQGDGTENRELTKFAHDGKSTTGWHTQEYYNKPDLGGLKDGVGLIVDLGAPREIGSVRIRLAQGPMDLSLYGTPTQVDDIPTSLGGLEKLGETTGADVNVSFAAAADTVTRFVVIWLTRLPAVDEGTYRGEIREIEVRPPA